MRMTDSESTRDPKRGDQSPPPPPRWVYAFAIIAIVVVVAFIVSHLLGGGFRGHAMP